MFSFRWHVERDAIARDVRAFNPPSFLETFLGFFSKEALVCRQWVASRKET